MCVGCAHTPGPYVSDSLDTTTQQAGTVPLGLDVGQMVLHEHTKVLLDQLSMTTGEGMQDVAQ